MLEQNTGITEYVLKWGGGGGKGGLGFGKDHGSVTCEV